MAKLGIVLGGLLSSINESYALNARHQKHSESIIERRSDEGNNIQTHIVLLGLIAGFVGYSIYTIQKPNPFNEIEKKTEDYLRGAIK